MAPGDGKAGVKKGGGRGKAGSKKKGDAKKGAEKEGQHIGHFWKAHTSLRSICRGNRIYISDLHDTFNQQLPSFFNIIFYRTCVGPLTTRFCRGAQIW